MSNGTLFYITGGVLAASAVIFSFAALRLEKLPGRATPAVALWFAILVGSATTFAVLHAKDEEAVKAEEFAAASEEIGREENGQPLSSEQAEPKPQPAAKGPGGALELAADPTQIAFDTTKLTSKPGKVTIDFTNPAALEHDVAIEQDGREIAVSETIAKGKTSVSADLAPGAYTFLCTVPGHAEAGMEGALRVR